MIDGVPINKQNNLDLKMFLSEIVIALTALTIAIATSKCLMFAFFHEDVEQLLSALENYPKPPLLPRVVLTPEGLFFEIVLSILTWVVSAIVFVLLTHGLACNVLSGKGSLRSFTKGTLWLNTGVALAVLITIAFFEMTLLTEFFQRLAAGSYLGQALERYQSGRSGYYLIVMVMFVGWSIVYSRRVKEEYQITQTRGCMTTVGAFMVLLGFASGIMFTLAVMISLSR